LLNIVPAAAAVFEILGPKLIGSRQVIGHVTSRFSIGCFLFASLDNFPVSHTCH